MEFTADQQKRIDYFRRSVRLDDVTTANDPAYQFTDEDLWAILEYSAPIHRGNSIDETDNKDFYFLLLLGKREVYYRLATTTAPFYPLSAEGASLEKNVRFDHYIKLVETVMKEYDNLFDEKYGDDDVSGTGGTVVTYNAKLYGRGYQRRYDQLSDDLYVELFASGETETSINLDWTKYDSTHGSDFMEYRIYVSESIILDEYSPTNKPIRLKPLHIIDDIRRTKIRITDLEPNKKYHILVEVKSTRGLKGYSQIIYSTSGKVPEKIDKEINMGGN